LSKITLLVGLGNPGADYEKTRHNAGAWLVETLAKQAALDLRAEKKFQGLCATLPTVECRLFLPTTFMNHCGQAIKAICQFYKIAPEAVLVAHDDLDLPAGTVKLKTGGGHGGHNGLRDTIQHLGGNHFHRIRLGIGHPGHRDRVHDYVLGRPSKADANAIHFAIADVLTVLPTILSGDMQKAMHQLHS